jgi:c-di-GMP-binding flagellar brake protein YcgR
MTKENLRAHKRAATPSIAAATLNLTENFRVTILNISRCGAMFQTVTPIATGSYLKLHFYLGESDTISCLAKVVWNRKAYGVLNRGGLQFMDIDPDVADKIDAYIARTH